MPDSTILRRPGLTLITFCILLTFTITVSAENKSSSKDLIKKRYDEWMHRYGRKYKDQEEYERRFAIYQTNLEYIEHVNSQNLSFTLADNQFADMTNQEFRSTYLGMADIDASHGNFSCGHDDDNQSDLPKSVNWIEKGAVTPAGSCWAFASVSAVEGLNKIKTNRLVELSVQQLVDCDLHNGDEGCSGGTMEIAYEFIKRKGLVAAREYPYTARDGACNQDKTRNSVVKIKGFKSVRPRDAHSLQAAVARQPVSAAIDGESFAFQLYSRGIFSSFCSSHVNHAVTVVGYGEEKGEKFWIVKNSWGSMWGESGYARMAGGGDWDSGICGILERSTYPVM